MATYLDHFPIWVEVKANQDLYLCFLDLYLITTLTEMVSLFFFFFFQLLYFDQEGSGGLSLALQVYLFYLLLVKKRNKDVYIRTYKFVGSGTFVEFCIWIIGLVQNHLLVLCRKEEWNWSF